MLSLMFALELSWPASYLPLILVEEGQELPRDHLENRHKQTLPATGLLGASVAIPTARNSGLCMKVTE